jgi:hypothetical protein
MKWIALVILLAGLAFAEKPQPNSTLYIPPASATTTVTDGTRTVTTTAAQFQEVLAAEIFKAHLAFQIVNDPQEATYVMQWAAIPEEGEAYGNGSLLIHAHSKTLYTVSVSLIDQNKNMIWASTADKKNLADAAQMITKDLQKTMKSKK